MSNDFNIIIEENLDIDIDEDEEDLNFATNQKNILETINNNAINKGLKGELSIKNYIYYNNYFITYSKKKEDEKELGLQYQNFTSLLSKSFNNTIKEYLDNYKDEKLKTKIMKVLGLTQEDLKKVEIQDNSNSSIVNPYSLIKTLKNIIDSLYKIEPNEKYIYELSKKYKETLLVIEEKKLRISFFGEYSIGNHPY